MQTVISLVLAILLCELLSVSTLQNNMTTQARNFVEAQAGTNANVVNEWLVESCRYYDRYSDTDRGKCQHGGFHSGLSAGCRRQRGLPCKRGFPSQERRQYRVGGCAWRRSQASQIRDYDGKMKFIATAAVEVTGWTLGVVQDKAVVTDLIRQNVIQVVLIGLVLIVVVTLIMIGSVKKSLKPMENMKFFIWDKVIGRENCRKQKAMVCWYFWTERS